MPRYAVVGEAHRLSLRGLVPLSRAARDRGTSTPRFSVPRRLGSGAKGEMDGRHSLDHDGERQGQSGGGPWGPAVVRTAIPPGTNLATISSMGPQGPLGSTTVGRILHKSSTIFPHKRNGSFALLSHSSSMLVTSADDDGRVARLPFTDSWVV